MGGATACGADPNPENEAGAEGAEADCGEGNGGGGVIDEDGDEWCIVTSVKEDAVAEALLQIKRIWTHR